jgi:SMI1 / KNR4 family (SUKH-1)
MESNIQLLTAIRQHCAARRWYGVDLRGPEWETSIAEADPRRTGFTCTPATTAQIEETESLLGFSLPPSLRLIYTQIANGGFGPAYGIRGAVGGFAEATGTVVEHYQSLCEGRTLLDLRLETAMQSTDDLVVPFEQWPRGLFSICDWGCAIQICLESTTGHVYRVEPSGDGYHITREAASLQAWLEQWVHAQLYV